MSIEQLKVLREEAYQCGFCLLHETRTNVVFGVGRAHRPPVMFLGEGPGANEDEQGEPFVGRAGSVLTKLIGWMGYDRRDVYITNVVLCRPPGNRKPKPEEQRACEHFLKGQISIVKPRVIVTLGSTSTHMLLGDIGSISKIRGTWFEFENVPLMPTFHPSYLLRSPGKMQDVYADLEEVCTKIQQKS